MAEEDRIKAPDLDAIAARLTQIGTLMIAVRKLSFVLDHDQAPCLQAVAEKAGWLSDLCIEELRGTMVCGDFNAWSANVNQDGEGDGDERP